MLSKIQIEENRRQILNWLVTIDRKGMGELLNYMDDNDFFNAPASKSHHQNYPGGLAEHSLGVLLRTLTELKTVSGNNANIKTESIILSALLHDLCKIDQYIIEGEIKSGDRVTGYMISSNHNANWDHAEKSIRLATQFISLNDEELAAIRYHMGIYKKDYSWEEFGNAIKKYPLVYLIHVADMKDTYEI